MKKHSASLSIPFGLGISLLVSLVIVGVSALPSTWATPLVRSAAVNSNLSSATALVPTAASSIPNQILAGQHGNAYFTPPGQPLDSAANSTRSLAWGDLDNDGDLDLAVGNNGQQNVVYINNGAGNFSTSLNFGTGSDTTLSLAWGDFDSDGYLDLAVGNYGGQNIVYINDGSGNLSSTLNVGTGSDSTYSVAWGDADGNSSLDLAVGNNGAQNRVYLNDGAGSFTGSVAFGTGTDATRSLAWGDVDNDNDLDLFIGNYGQQNRVYLNDGSGGFTSGATFGTGSDGTISLDVGDVNGNGYPDVATVNSPFSEPTVIYFNDETGDYPSSDSIRLFGRGRQRSIALADADSDGDLDVAVGSQYRYPNRVFLNDGTTEFRDTRYFYVSHSAATYALAWGDADGDGDLDLAVGNNGQSNALVHNQQKNDPVYYYTSTVLLEDVDGTTVELAPAYPDGWLRSFSMLKEGDVTYLWLNSQNSASGSNRVSREQRLESQDGLLWTNRTDTNLIDTTADYHRLVGITTVRKEGNTYEAWEQYYYNVVDGMWVHRIRYLTSNTGIDWTVVSPEIMPSGNQANVVKNKGQYYMWVEPHGDTPYTGTTSMRYRTSTSGGSGWGHWQTGGALVKVDGDEVMGRAHVRELTGGTYELFYVYGTSINRAISADGVNFTTQDVAILDLNTVLPKHLVVYYFVVMEMNGEDWFYFTYRDKDGFAHMAVSRPQDVILNNLQATNDSPTILGNSTVLTATISAGTNVTYTWDFGDGTTGTGDVLSHVYPAVGTYTAVVTATNSVNQLTATTNVTVTDATLSGLTAVNNSPTTLGTTTTLTATTATGTNVTYTWDFGDGTTGTGDVLSHVYPAVGSYPAVVTATNSVSQLTATTTVTVTDAALSGLTAVNDSPTTLGTTTTLTATTATGTNVTYTWDFGDGTTGTGAVPTHIYPAVGNYMAVVTATNSANLLTATTAVTVRPRFYDVHLPVVINEICIESSQPADIVLAIDVSGSMTDPTEPDGPSKLEVAQSSAIEFLTLLNFPDDQAAVISFANEATLEHALSVDRTSLTAAIGTLEIANHTRLDLALALARSELTGPRHLPDNSPVLILLTDGQPHGIDEATVLAEAAATKAQGIRIYTIGLGHGVNAGLLEEMATGADYYYQSPSTAELNEIYQQIAAVLHCP